jgi:hypothetical protein
LIIDRDTARRIGLAALATALTTCLAIAAPAATAKKKGGGAVNVTKPVNLPIPDATPGSLATGLNGQAGILTSTIDVGKQFKGRKIRDVNVTVQTAGTSGNTPANDLVFRLTAPNGATMALFANLAAAGGAPNLSIGPLTIDDQGRLLLGTGAPSNPTQLFAPWAGTAVGFGPLAVMNNGPVRGTWTLRGIDVTTGETSNLVFWSLQVTAGRPFQTK